MLCNEYHISDSLVSSHKARPFQQPQLLWQLQVLYSVEEKCAEILIQAGQYVHYSVHRNGESNALTSGSGEKRSYPMAPTTSICPSPSCPSLHTLVSAQAGCTPPSLHSSERKIERGRCEHVLHICTPPSNQQGSWWKTFAFLNYTYTFSPQLIIFLKHKSMFLKSLRKLKVGWHKLYQSTCVAVPSRKRTLFRCVFRSHH